MKILIVTHYFRPHIGGIEVVAYNQAKELVRKGHKVTIITSKLNGDKDTEIIDGVKILRIKAWNFLEKRFDIPFPIFSLKLIKTIDSEIKKNDVVHVHGALYLGSLIASLIAKKYKKPFIATEHVGFVRYNNFLVNIIEKIAFHTIGKITLNNSTRVLLLNKRVKNFVSSLTNTKIEYVLNGVDTKLFKPVNKAQELLLRKKYGLPIDRKLVLFVGRFVQKKGIDLLVKAKSPDFDLVLVGTGEIVKDIYKLKGIFIFESLPQKKLAEIYQACDVFVLPSKGEGFPLSIQEAMASKLPVITCKENVQVSGAGNIAYFIMLTSIDLQKAILDLLKNNILRSKIQDKAYEIAVEEFNWSRNVDLLVRQYKRVLMQARKQEFVL